MAKKIRINLINAVATCMQCLPIFALVLQGRNGPVDITGK